MAEGGKRQRRGAVFDVDRADALAVVNRVNRDVLGVEVGHVEHGIVSGDQTANRIVSDRGGAADFVGGGVDLGDGIGERVRDEDFAAIGLEG